MNGLNALRCYIRGDFTLDCDKAATQAIWDACQQAEEQFTAKDAEIERERELRKQLEAMWEEEIEHACPQCTRNSLKRRGYTDERIDDFIASVKQTVADALATAEADKPVHAPDCAICVNGRHDCTCGAADKKGGE